MPPQKLPPPAEKLTREKIYKEFGVSKKGEFPHFYKVENNYVPDTKEELADHLMEKL
jgi:hypothetical protein